ncbi:unnamed protein product, partial [Mesorhabditis spiculigera]
MVAQSSRGTTTPRTTDEPHLATEEKPAPNVKKKDTKKKGFLSIAAGGLRKALGGPKTPRSARVHYPDAEDIIPEEDEECSVYDTVRSLPASGHYGRSRVGHHHPQIILPGQLRVSIDEPASQPILSPISTSVIKLPRRRSTMTTAIAVRTSPKGSMLESQALQNFGGHRGILNFQPSMFSSFESMTIGGSIETSTIYFESQDAAFSLFMKAHKCYDLIPISSKLIVFDTHLPVRKAFYALIYNNVRAAPLYDSAKGSYVGMLTITDFIKILYRYYEAGLEGEEGMKSLEEQEISHWRQRFEQDSNAKKELITIDPLQSLYQAVELLVNHKVHRLPVLDQEAGNICYILTHKRLMKFLYFYMSDLPRPTFLDKTPRELGIGSWGEVLTIHTDTPLIEALRTFLANRVSALPIVDSQDKVVDIYAKFDVISLAAEKVYDKLDVTVSEALKYRTEAFEGVHCCNENDTLYQVIETLVRAEVHRLVATDANKKVVGIVSLSDILKYLVLDSASTRPEVEINEPAPSPVFESVEEEAEGHH